MNPTAIPAGPLASLIRPISRLLRVGNARYLVGHDLEGNSYYEYPSRSGSTDPRHTRRVIEYRIKQANYFEYDRSELPIQWKQWLRHTRRVAPSLEELQQDRQRILQLQENVRLIAIRDEEARQRFEQKRLEEHDEAMSSSRQQQRQTTSAAASPSGVSGTPPLGQAPDQTRSEAQASTEASDAARRAMESEQQQQQQHQATPSPPASSSTSSPTPPRSRTRSRAPINSIPTSDVNDEGVAEQKQRRIPVSTMQTSADANTEEGQRVAGRIVEERQADNDVWKASRERIERQDRGQDAPAGRRQYSTIITPQVMGAFRR